MTLGSWSGPALWCHLPLLPGQNGEDWELLRVLLNGLHLDNLNTKTQLLYIILKNKFGIWWSVLLYWHTKQEGVAAGLNYHSVTGMIRVVCISMEQHCDRTGKSLPFLWWLRRPWTVLLQSHWKGTVNLSYKVEKTKMSVFFPVQVCGPLWSHHQNQRLRTPTLWSLRT